MKSTKFYFNLIAVILFTTSLLYAREYHIQDDFEDSSAENNTDISVISANSKTVSDEDISFSEIEPGIFLAQDSVKFDESGIILSCAPLNENATVVFSKQPYPPPGGSDTAIFEVWAEDGMTTKEYHAIVARSVYQCKAGFLTSGADAAPSGWFVEGGNYASSSRGDGGEFPGNNGMRIYNSDNKGLGILTSPVYSSISTLSFAAKFSFTDDESLIVKKSTDDGSTWQLVKTYTPAGGEIPSYTTEQAADTLAVQRLDINEENVIIAFHYLGSSTTPRLMIDDIACLSNYDPEARYNVTITVHDLDHLLLEGATVILNDQELVTGSNGVASFDTVPTGAGIPYSIAKDGFTTSGTMTVFSTTAISITLLTEELDIFLALGQSNMAGRATINDYVNQEIDGVYLLNDENVWIPAINPMNLYSNIRKDESMQKLGPSYSFSKTLSEYIENRIGMVVNARGGTNLSEFATGSYHDPIMQRIKETNVYGKIKAVIWHQGEGDRSKADLYMVKLNSLVNDIRAEIGEDVFFVAGQLGPWDEIGTTTPKYGVINDTISKIAHYIANSDYAVNNEISDLGDNTHFNHESQILLGQRYAKKILSELYNINISVFDFNIEGDGYVIYEDDIVTSANGYSFTRITDDNVAFSVHAGDGKKFVQLEINGVKIEEAIEASTYNHNLIAATDTLISIAMTVQSIETPVIENSIIKDPVFYPNPASDNISIIGIEGDFSVSIYDLRGRMVLLCNNDKEINIQKLLPGIYTLMVHIGQTRNVKKLMVL